MQTHRSHYFVAVSNIFFDFESAFIRAGTVRPSVFQQEDQTDQRKQQESAWAGPLQFSGKSERGGPWGRGQGLAGGAAAAHYSWVLSVTGPLRGQETRAVGEEEQEGESVGALLGQGACWYF